MHVVPSMATCGDITRCVSLVHVSHACRLHLMPIHCISYAVDVDDHQGTNDGIISKQRVQSFPFFTKAHGAPHSCTLNHQSRDRLNSFGIPPA